jgi:hypothetical protein
MQAPSVLLAASKSTVAKMPKSLAYFGAWRIGGTGLQGTDVRYGFDSRPKSHSNARRI